ncbi:unnamed protein product [Gongylonema pulchrum]|uniref:DHO_dh domain-containing protein n=1 Tax=Gongylonema pulchrum TaxID=637853 RepID=A0A183DV81_9BILA|nr:unnamed protein product [Gongylonema pulchrum]
MSNSFAAVDQPRSDVKILRDFSWCAKLSRFIADLEAVKQKYITKSTAIIVSSSTLLYGFIEYVTGNETFQRKQLMPLLHYILGPEKIVRLNVHLAKHHLLPPFGQSYREYPELRCSTMGIQFNNPLGLAAGFDKG